MGVGALCTLLGGIFGGRGRVEGWDFLCRGQPKGLGRCCILLRENLGWQGSEGNLPLEAVEVSSPTLMATPLLPPPRKSAPKKPKAEGQ